MISTRRPGSGVDVSRSTVTLLIPARNEERNIGWVLERVPLSVDEIIVIDGRSADRTIEVARAIRPDVRVVTEIGRGKGAAIRTGVAAATGDIVVMLDADGSMDPAEIDAFLRVIAAGADLVKGSRFVAAGGTTDITRVRSLGNRALLGVVNALYGTRHSELCYGFMAFRRGPILELGLRSDGFEIEAEIVVRSIRARLDVQEVPSMEAPRRSGASNLHATRDGLRILRTVVTNRIRRPAFRALPPVVQPGPILRAAGAMFAAGADTATFATVAETEQEEAGAAVG